MIIPPDHIRFAEAVAAGMSKVEAYRRIFGEDNRFKASHLAKRADVAHKIHCIREGQEDGVSRLKTSLQGACDQLADALFEANSLGPPFAKTAKEIKETIGDIVGGIRAIERSGR